MNSSTCNSLGATAAVAAADALVMSVVSAGAVDVLVGRAREEPCAAYLLLMRGRMSMK